jgi:DNA primase
MPHIAQQVIHIVRERVMPHIPPEVINTVREQVDIVKIIERHVRLKRQGSNHKGLCPFHQEKTPSFNVVPSKGIYHCFGCQASGDVFKFLMEIEGLNFVEAVKELAADVGVTVPERELTPGELQAIRNRASLFELLEQAADFFSSILWTHSDGRAARAYLLEERGLSADTIKRARLGYAPDSWDRLRDHLKNKGYSYQRSVEAGLVRSREGHQNSFYDVFRDRVVFPIYDDRGRIIGFGGRIMEGDGPKYLNSPETRLYQKSKVLYGIEIARAAAQKKDEILIVEGYFDVLALQQAGFEHTVATCGTALTGDHITKIRRLTLNAVVITDSDEAGARAAEKFLPLCLEHGVQPWRVDIPGAKDPDELIRNAGPTAFEAALANKEPLVEWVLQRRLAGAGGVMGRGRVIEELMPILLRLPPAAVSAVAARLGHEQALLEQIDKARRSARRAEPLAAPAPAPGWEPMREISHIFWLLVHRYEQVADLLQRVDPEIFFATHAPARPAIARLQAGEPVASVISDEQEGGVQRTLVAVVAKDSLYTVEEAPLAICQILDGLAKPRYESALSLLTRTIENAASRNETEQCHTALQHRAECNRLRASINTALRRAEVDESIRLLIREMQLIERLYER